MSDTWPFGWGAAPETMGGMQQLSTLFPHLAAGLGSTKDKVPAPEDVTAGWLGFWVFIILIVAVALLGLSLSRHLRRARDNAAAGMFGPSEKTEHPAQEG